MKTLFRSLFLFAVCQWPALNLHAEISAAAWLEGYYLNPQPDELPAAIRRLSVDGYFDRPGHVAIAIGFISTVFAAHPDKVEGWVAMLGGLPPAHARLIAGALWQAGHPLGEQALPILARDSALRAAVEQLAHTPPRAIIDTPVLSASSMNLQWGAFLASGDEHCIVAILDAIGADQPGLDATARMTLAREAAAHPRVLEICRAQLDRAAEEKWNGLRAVLNEAAARPRS